MKNACTAIVASLVLLVSIGFIGLIGCPNREDGTAKASDIARTKHIQTPESAPPSSVKSPERSDVGREMFFNTGITWKNADKAERTLRDR